MGGDEEPSDEPRLFEDNINRYIFFEEDRKRAMGILAPSSEQEMELRRLIIARLRGKVPERIQTYRAMVAMEDIMADLEGRDLDIEKLRMIEWNIEAGMGIDAFRAKQIENMGTANPRPEAPKSFWDRFMGRKK